MNSSVMETSGDCKTNMANNATAKETKIHKLVDTFKSFNNEEKTLAIQKILCFCEPEQLLFLSEQLPNIVRRDFIRYLPSEVLFHILKYLDYKTISRCFLVSKTWNELLSSHNKAWIRACESLGVVKRSLLNKTTTNLKCELRKGIKRLEKLKSYERAFKTKVLTGHSQRITALHYNKGFLASGK